jgi:N-acetylglutamate synthase-like GNAT family acetyltransferase
MEKIKLLVSDIIPSRFIYHMTKESWGFEVLIMEKEGDAFARAYWYHDDNDGMYLNWLTVSMELRKQGIGTELQNIREEIAKKLGAKYTYLQAENGSWMREWYKRRGYKDCENTIIEENLVWMQKEIK